MATSVASSIIGGKASKKASKQMVAAQQAAIAEQRRQFEESEKNLNNAATTARGDLTTSRDTSLGYFNPFLTTGTAANNQLGYNLGIGGSDQSGGTVGDYGSLSRPFTMADYEEDPGYQFRLEEGQKALARMQGAKGQYFSGAALRGLTDYNQRSASQEYQNAFDRYNTNQANLYNRLAGVSNSGQNAAGSMANINTNAGNNLANVTTSTASNIANLGANKAAAVGTGLTNIGNAQAQGTLGAAQQWQTGLQGVSNAIGYAAGLGNPIAGSATLFM